MRGLWTRGANSNRLIQWLRQIECLWGFRSRCHTISVQIGNGTDGERIGNVPYRENLVESEPDREQQRLLVDHQAAIQALAVANLYSVNLQNNRAERRFTRR